MKKIIIITAVIVTINFLNSVFADDPPVASDVANTVSNYWVNDQLTDLGSYVTNLYVSYSNYVPAILVSSFHDYVYLGKLNDAKTKLVSIEQAISNELISVDDYFSSYVGQNIGMLNREINRHVRHGRTDIELQSNASPVAVKAAWNGYFPYYLDILFYAPSTTITNTP